MFNSEYRANLPVIVGSGLVVLDIVLSNGDTAPIFSAGGTCGNVLAALSHLGWNSICLSRLGVDAAGELLEGDLIKNAVDTSWMSKERSLATPRIIERVSSAGVSPKHHFLFRCPTCNSYLPRFRSPRIDQILGIPASIMTPDVFFFDRATPSALQLAEQFRNKGALIFFEPGKLVFDAKTLSGIRLSHILKFAGRDSSIDETRVALQNEEHSPLLIIKTLGEDGLVFRCEGSEDWHYQPSFRPFQIRDCCGAGDWCSTGFLFKLKKNAIDQGQRMSQVLHRLDWIESCLEYGQAMSSLSCGFLGARGLSNVMSQDLIIETISSLLKVSADQFTLNLNILSRPDTLHQEYSQKLCRTCLLTKG